MAYYCLLAGWQKVSLGTAHPSSQSGLTWSALWKPTVILVSKITWKECSDRVVMSATGVEMRTYSTDSRSRNSSGGVESILQYSQVEHIWVYLFRQCSLGVGRMLCITQANG